MRFEAEEVEVDGIDDDVVVDDDATSASSFAAAAAAAAGLATLLLGRDRRGASVAAGEPR